MLHKLKNRKQEGFTIIEVLIVLAIAGLILLIVFLAVPALQRNARNTSSRNEAASVLGGTNEFIANNNGKSPATGASGTPGTDAEKIWANVKTQTLTSISVEAENGNGVPTATNAVIATTAKCGTANNPATTAGRAAATDPGSSARQFAILYLIETGSTSVIACTEG
jgi:prepilin-type N-terminal cleavage/methylation domain-containing protein